MRSVSVVGVSTVTAVMCLCVICMLLCAGCDIAMCYGASMLVGLNLLVEAIRLAGYTGKMDIGMDVAASEFFKDGVYDLDFKNKNSDKTKCVSIVLHVWMIAHMH